MDSTQIKILDKVKKLLALSKSPSEAEAASALEKAQVLLAMYGLSMDEIRQESDVREELLLEKRRLRTWESSLIYFVCKATFTEAIHYSSQKVGRILLIGRELNLVTARELFAYLHQIILILGRKHNNEVAHLESFRQGIVHRIGERLYEQNREPVSGQKSAEDLAPVVMMSASSKLENTSFIKQKYGETSSKKIGRRVESDSYYRGKAVGDQISLNKQIQ